MPSFLSPPTPLRACIALVLAIFSLRILYGTVRGQMRQQPLFGSPRKTPIPKGNRTYSVGFHLASSYGAAAVILSNGRPSDPDANVQTYTITTTGSDTYKSTMAHLSLQSSEHLAPPYNSGMDDYSADLPRVLARRARKKLGLPASADVGSLSTVIISLVEQIRSALNFSVEDAVITSTPLNALYQDDLYDIAQYAGLQYMEPNRLYKPILWEMGASCAGHGLNLCSNFRNKTACDDEIRAFHRLRVLEVHYSATALASTFATMLTLTSAYGEDYRRIVDLRLEVMLYLVVVIEDQRLGGPDLVILTGDQHVNDDEFRAVLGDGLMGVMGQDAGLPGILDDDAMVIAAKGAAELRRRGARVPREN